MTNIWYIYKKKVNGEDILGKKIVQVAEKIKMNSLNNENGVTLLLWNSGSEQVKYMVLITYK